MVDLSRVLYNNFDDKEKICDQKSYTAHGFNHIKKNLLIVVDRIRIKSQMMK